MKKSIFASLFLVCLSQAPADALDLTPHAVTTAINNLRVNRYFFDDAGRQMGFRIDNNMTVKGTSASADFNFRDLRSADMQIIKSRRNPEMLFGEKELEIYRGDARAVLPTDATDVQLDREKSGAIPINGWTSYQFVFSYKLFGFAYRRTVTFVNYNRTEQLIVDVSAQVPEFELASLRSYQVLNSLSELRINSSGST